VDKDKRVFIAGHMGMVGSAIFRHIKNNKAINIITKSHAELDLTNQSAVANFFDRERPDQVFLAAAKVGGIYANNEYPAEFIYQNLMIEANIIHHAFISGVKKLLFLGSSCIYPKLASQPIKENALLSGYLEPTNEPYAIAKIAGIKLCESYNRQYGVSHGLDYRCIMPSNLYGPGDNYHSENSHVIPALIRRFHEAKSQKMPIVNVWGTGEPRREFLYVDDLASASIFIMNLDQATYKKYTDSMNSHINVGVGFDISIKELAFLIANTVGYKGKIMFDCSKPNGSPRKLMDISRLKEMGWMPAVNLTDGLKIAYQDFLMKFSK
jgi:GDP-L-fucose synthase